MATEKQEKKKSMLHKQSITSFLVTFSFVVVAVSGIMMFMVPPGRIASWTEWKFVALTREEWVRIHIILSVFFAGISIYHLILNWRIFVNYIISKVSKGFHRTRELVVSLIIILVLTGGAYLKVVPFEQFITFNEWVKTIWVTSPEFEPPIAHAEALTLASFTTKMGMDLGQVAEELKKQNVSVKDVNDTLSIIGEQNNISPMAIYMKIKKFEKPLTPSTVFTEDMVTEKFEGRGIGEKTLAQVAKENNLDLDTMKKRLAAQGTVPGEGETLRQLADRQKVKKVPIQIMKMALVDQKAASPETPKEAVPGGKKTVPTVKTPTVTPEAAPVSATQKALVYTEEMVKAQFEGKGIGEKPLAQVAKENNLDMEYIKKRLSAKGFSMKEGETVKEIGARYNVTPIEFMKMLLVEGPSGK
jgi:predicted DsbA family dithiol-disulfide isomerase